MKLSFDKAMEVIQTRDESKICKYFKVPNIDFLLEALKMAREIR